jgi:putative FmdB family regulatory protein
VRQGEEEERLLMPLYEYYCGDCKSRFEVLTSYEASQSNTVMCASCHGTRVRKLLSVVARTRHGGDDAGEFGDFGDGGEFGDEGDDDLGGSCSCGGACSCSN